MAVNPKAGQAKAHVRVFVATDNEDDAAQVVNILEGHFQDVAASARGEEGFGDFTAFAPDVLVLAFDAIEKAERHYLGLYRRCPALPPHRTVLLCDKDELAAAFDLCKRECFDDYVFFWPHSHDPHRLAMSVLALSRRGAGAPQELPRPAELLAHARHLTELENVVANRGQASANDLVQRMQPALAGTRPLAHAVKNLRPIVLVVDDDPFAIRLAKLALDPARWDVHTAGSGPAALALLGRLRPDAMLIDVQMPGMTGIELATRIKAMPAFASMPVVMMTGNARRETLEGSVEAGAVGFIVKPMSAATLEARLQPLVPR